MVESMFQACMYLVRATTEFKYSTVVLKEANSLKFQGFVQPGDQLKVSGEVKSAQESITKLKVTATINDEVASSGRLVLDHYNLAEREGVDPAIDNYMIRQFRLNFRRLCNQLDQSDIFNMSKTPQSETITNS